MVIDMIPKTIHYCWFGRGKKPKLAQKCIASWRKYCPDYKIIEWNEDNFNVGFSAYTRNCYEQKKYAFLTDYLRLKAVYDHGGVYLDTDVELVRPLDDLLDNEAFFGFENNEHVATGLGFGAEIGDELVMQMLHEYDPLLDGAHGFIGCPILNTQALLKFGLKLNGEMQHLSAGAVVYPEEYFNPCNSATGELRKTENTYSIHWYAGSWLSPVKRLRRSLTRPIHRLFGEDVFHRK